VTGFGSWGGYMETIVPGGVRVLVIPCQTGLGTGTRGACLEQTAAT